MFAKKNISCMFSVLFVVILMLAITPLQAAVAAGVRYAKPTASGTGDCSSWADACILQTALTGAVSGDEIWAAAGTYKPTTDPTNRGATFQLKNGVALYGGFAGTETARNQRNPAVHVTILSGDIDNNDSQTPIITDPIIVTGNTSNSYHVVTGVDGATLDGFTITAGYANAGSNCPGVCGGGMYNNSSSPTLTNVIFSGNSATNGGGGGAMYNQSSHPTLNNVIFTGNLASYGDGTTQPGQCSVTCGAGMYNTSGSSPTLTNVAFYANNADGSGGGGMENEGNSNPTLTNVIFSGNSASDGGGMDNESSNPILTNVTFSGNSATNGGGMDNQTGSPTLTNVTFSGNSASFGGGMANESSSPTLTNVTFSGNHATGSGGGMGNAFSSPTLTNVTFSSNATDSGGGGIYDTSSSPQIRNTILWGNTASSSGAQVLDNGSTSSVSYSVIQGGYAGGTNILTADPLLGTLGNHGGFTQTIPLQAGSSAINTGNDAFCPATDQRGVARPQGTHCDIGAYELDTTAPIVKSITRLDPNPTGRASVNFDVTFSEPVIGVYASDFFLATVGVAGASVAGVSGSGSVYTVTVNTGIGNGTLRLGVPAGATISDLALNPLASLPYTGGETYTITKVYIFLPLILR